MKKLSLLLIAFCSINFISAQGAPPYSNDDTMYIYNYTNYSIYGGTITAKDEANCWPAVQGSLA